MAGNAEHMAKMRAARKKKPPASAVEAKVVQLNERLAANRQAAFDRRNWLRKQAGWPERT
jgi:hypothetical protein